MKIIPDFGPAHLSMAICFTEWGRYKEALAKIKDSRVADGQGLGSRHHGFHPALQDFEYFYGAIHLSRAITTQSG